MSGDARAESIINASVCGPEIQPSLTIASPQPDSTVNTVSFDVLGTVERANQLLVKVDDVYDQTQAVGTSETTYTVTVSSTSGTHKVTITAVAGNCEVSESVLVRIVPGSDPIPPVTETPTAQAPVGSSGGVSGGSGIIISDTPLSTQPVTETGGVAGFTKSIRDSFSSAGQSVTPRRMLETVLTVVFVIGFVTTLFYHSFATNVLHFRNSPYKLMLISIPAMIVALLVATL